MDISSGILKFMKREQLIQNIEKLKHIMPSYVLEYYQSKLTIPYSLNTL